MNPAMVPSGSNEGHSSKPFIPQTRGLKGKNTRIRKDGQIKNEIKNGLPLGTACHGKAPEPASQSFILQC